MTNETNSTTPPPVSEERLKTLIELASRTEAANRQGAKDKNDVLSVMRELEVARTTIAALRKDVEDYRLTHLTIAGVLGFSAPASHNQICAETRAVVAERDELRRDALRYRWLRLYACANEFNWMMDDVDDQLSVEDAARKLDDAIDAQLAITPSPLSVPHE